MLLLLLPPGFVVGGALTPGAGFLAGVGVLVALLYVLVWCYYRPSRFELGYDGLRLSWPWRERTIPLGRLAGAEILDRRELRSRLGFAARVGVGGLWGGFGLLWTSRAGWLDFYISRVDGAVLVHVVDGHDLLITPERPAEFVERLESLRDA